MKSGEAKGSSAGEGAIATCKNKTQGLGVVVVEYSVKFIFDELPNDDTGPIHVYLRDGESHSYQTQDERCCVGYIATIKWTWPQGQAEDMTDGKAPAGKCYVRFGFGIVPARAEDVAVGKPPVEVVVMPELSEDRETA
jgi:hypothetical protein